MGYNK